MLDFISEPFNKKVLIGGMILSAVVYGFLSVS